MPVVEVPDTSLITDLPFSTIKEVAMFYVGVSHYFATGEGFTIYVTSGSEEAIRKSIPESFHQGLTILTPSEWLKAATGDCDDEYPQC